VANSIADGLRGNRFGVLGEFPANGSRRSVHSNGGDNVTILGEIGNHLLNPTPEAAVVPHRGFQLEDGCPDLLDDGLEIVERAVESVDNLRRTCAGHCALQIHACGKQSLDDVVVQVVRDALTLGHNRQLARVLTARRKHECYRSMGGEIAHQVEVTVVEWWPVCAAGDGDHSCDFIVGP
jgi:hypothetical protein